MKKCPFCGEEIHDAAVQCKHCGNALNKPPKKAIIAFWFGMLTSIALLMGGCVMYNMAGCAAALSNDEGASRVASGAGGVYWIAVLGIVASVGIKKMKKWGWKLQFAVAIGMWLLMMAGGLKAEYFVGNLVAVTLVLSPLFISAVLGQKAMKETLNPQPQQAKEVSK